MENLGFGLWVSGFKNSSLLETFFWFFYQFGDCVTVQEKELGHGKSDFWISLGPAPHAHTHTQLLNTLEKGREKRICRFARSGK